MLKRLKSFHLWVVLFFAFLYSLYSFFAFSFFHYPARDLGEYTQVVWNLSQGKLPQSTIKPTPNYFGLYFQPILILLSFIFKLWPSPLFLLIIQSLIVSLGGLPIFWLAKTNLKDKLAPLLIMTAYLLFFGIQNALAFGFYPISLGSSFFAFCLWFAEKKRWTALFVFLFLSFLCQENVALYFLFLAIYLILFKKEVKIGGFIGVLSLTWYLFVVFLVMPQISGRPYPHFVFEPILRFFWPPVKIKTLLLLFGSVLFLNFFSLPEMLLCIPMLFEQFLIARSSHWTVAFHYDISIAPPLFLTVISTLKKFPRKRYLPVFLFCWSVFLNFALDLPLARILRPSFYRKTQREEILEKMVRLVPGRVSVSATDILVPHLSTRKEIYHFVSAQEELERKPEFILLGGEKDSWPLNPDSYKREVKKLEESETYEAVFQREDKYIFKLSRS